VIETIDAAAPFGDRLADAVLVADLIAKAVSFANRANAVGVLAVVVDAHGVAAEAQTIGKGLRMILLQAVVWLALKCRGVGAAGSQANFATTASAGLVRSPG